MADGNGSLQVGTTIGGRYRVDGLLGSGGMGIVYRVTHQVTRHRHALKTIRADQMSNAELVARFLLEASATADINSEHIVRVTDAGVDDQLNLPFFVMELLTGRSLDAEIQVRTRLDARETLDLFRQITPALDKVHSAGIVHRDLKPENLFLTTNDEGKRSLKILDFGIAKLVDPRTNAKTTRNIGTPLYMSPEQYQGDGHIDHRADLYSMAHIAFALLTGHAYWESEAQRGSLAVMWKVVNEGVREPATTRAQGFGVSLPAEFDEWFSMATEKDPYDRFDSVSELVDRLEGVFRGRAPGDRPIDSAGLSGDAGPLPSISATAGGTRLLDEEVHTSTTRFGRSPVRPRTIVVGVIVSACVGAAVFAVFTRARHQVDATGRSLVDTVATHSEHAQLPASVSDPPVAPRAAPLPPDVAPPMREVPMAVTTAAVLPPEPGTTTRTEPVRSHPTVVRAKKTPVVRAPSDENDY